MVLLELLDNFFVSVAARKILRPPFLTVASGEGWRVARMRISASLAVELDLEVCGCYQSLDHMVCIWLGRHIDSGLGWSPYIGAGFSGAGFEGRQFTFFIHSA